MLSYCFSATTCVENWGDDYTGSTSGVDRFDWRHLVSRSVGVLLQDCVQHQLCCISSSLPRKFEASFFATNLKAKTAHGARNRRQNLEIKSTSAYSNSNGLRHTRRQSVELTKCTYSSCKMVEEKGDQRFHTLTNCITNVLSDSLPRTSVTYQRDMQCYAIWSRQTTETSVKIISIGLTNTICLSRLLTRVKRIVKQHTRLTAFIVIIVCHFQWNSILTRYSTVLFVVSVSNCNRST